MNIAAPANTVICSEIFHGRKTEQCGVILFGTEGVSFRRFIS